MLEGMYFENVIMHPETRVYPQYPITTGGEFLGSDSVYRYGLRESSYPTLTIVDEISNGEGEIIPAGHYELALSDDKQFLILIEAKQPIAIIPVFKTDITMDAKPQIHDNKSLKAQRKKDKEIIKTNKKRAKEGMPPIDQEEQVYKEASMEYIKEGNYYLIRYENGDIKAWAAIKAD